MKTVVISSCDNQHVYCFGAFNSNKVFEYLNVRTRNVPELSPQKSEAGIGVAWFTLVHSISSEWPDSGDGDSTIQHDQEDVYLRIAVTDKCSNSSWIDKLSRTG